MAKRKRRSAPRRPENPVYTDDLPTLDYFEYMGRPDDIDQVLQNLIDDLQTGYFLRWEAVMRQEQGLPLTPQQKRALGELISFNDEEDERILYINEVPRPSEPWYEIARKVASHILQDPLRTVDGGFWAMYEGWPELVEAMEEHGPDLSLPPDVASPLDIFPPDLKHRLWLQYCFDALLGLGQDEQLTLAREEQQHRVRWLIECLKEHQESVVYFDLTLETLLSRIELPPVERPLLVELMTKELDLTSPQQRLAERL